MFFQVGCLCEANQHVMGAERVLKWAGGQFGEAMSFHLGPNDPSIRGLHRKTPYQTQLFEKKKERSKRDQREIKESSSSIVPSQRGGHPFLANLRILRSGGGFHCGAMRVRSGEPFGGTRINRQPRGLRTSLLRAPCSEVDQPNGDPPVDPYLPLE